MDTNQPTAGPPPLAATSSRGMFGTGIPSTVCFAIAVLMFLLPFSEIKCGGTALVNKSGLNFAMAKEWKASSNLGGKDLMDQMPSKSKGEKEGNSQILIIVAMGLAVLSLLFALVGGIGGSRLGMVTGVLGAGALIAFMIDLKKWFSDQMAKQAADKAKEATDSFDKNLGATMHIGFTTWFYVAVVALLAGAFFCYQRTRNARRI